LSTGRLLYDPVDFKNDSDDEIYKKLLNNITTFVKAKNKAIRTRETMAAVYIEELIRLDNIYGDIHKSPPRCRTNPFVWS